MNYKSVMILGRQPAIGRAELESLYGADGLVPLGDFAVASNIAPASIAFDRLGSTVKLGEYLGTIQDGEWRAVQRQLTNIALARAQDLGEGKIQLGLSVYGMRAAPSQLTGAGLEIKKTLRNAGYSVRLVPNQEIALSSAQVLHNHLAGERGLELLLIRHGSQIVIARTTNVQDITAYARRDQGRPKRDAFVGMLPPKLAQTIINLGTGSLPPSSENIVLDPFCGTGVILQEALLMGYGAYGADLEPRMIDYSRENLDWLSDHLASGAAETPLLEVGDATTHHWQSPFSVVASETYLGRPLSAWPAPEKLQEIIGNCNVIIEHFMRNIAAQIPVGTRLCLAVPAWVNPSGAIRHLPVLDRLNDLGYNRVSFSGVRAQDLVYYRPEQLVARELLVMVRK
jgi:tRNA (guanine10-N2)-dimethyltransferase